MYSSFCKTNGHHNVSFDKGMKIQIQTVTLLSTLIEFQMISSWG